MTEAESIWYFTARSREALLAHTVTANNHVSLHHVHSLHLITTPPILRWVIPFALDPCVQVPFAFPLTEAPSRSAIADSQTRTPRSR